MQIYFLQIAIFTFAFLIFNHYRMGLKYFCLFLTPFYAMAIAGLTEGVSTNILPIHIAGITLLGLSLVRQMNFRKSELLRYGLIIFPFILSLGYNLLFFETTEGWEMQAENRFGKNISIKYSLSITNITQLIYIIFGLVMALLFSSIPLDKSKLKKTLDVTLISVAVIGALQVISYYAGIHTEYKSVFNTTNLKMADQMFLWGWKRINACFQEPSYMGHYLYFSLCFYLICFGYSAFLKSKAVWAAVAIGILSTATTFYAGFCVLLMYMYIKHATPNQKMLYYVAFTVIALPLVYFSFNIFIDYFNAKQSSTDNRFYVGWDLAWSAIAKSPFFGFAYGTHRPLFVYTQLLASIGIIGTVFFVYALLQQSNRAARSYLLLILGIGIFAFEMTRHEMWIYFGLLSNRWLYDSPTNMKAPSAVETRWP